MTKIALVTGGGLRIGRAVARALAGAGYAVAIHYNNSKDSAAALAAEITAAGGKARTLGQDLADIPGSQALVGRAAELMGGPVSLLINSASLYLAESLDDAGFCPSGTHWVSCCEHVGYTA
jgi:NAD(P)-dependent dehydrogenase (short-subunit alcohol dehydrogenase family)